MEVVYERCCGIDVHKRSVVACRICRDEAGGIEKEIRRFGTMTDDLLALADWLAAHQVSHVAMESTGSYWKPVWNVLEGEFELLLVNPQHVKALSGNKTDVKDAGRLADFLRHGLLKASFVPNRAQRELRELTRFRTSLVQERAAEVNRLQKVLEGANIKLASVASNILGKSGREMLEALLAGESAPQEMAELARGRLREKIPQLERALAGRFGPHQRFMVAQQLAHIDFLDERIGEVSKEIGGRLRPFEQEIAKRLDVIPGVASAVTEVVLAEVGPDVSRFASADCLTSWAGICPGNNESAGKRKSGKTRKGNQALCTVLVQAAQAASMKTGSYLQAQFLRLAARLGRKKAIIALSRQILVIIYHLLRHPTSVFSEKGAHYLREDQLERTRRHHVRRLEALGFTVVLQPTAA